VIAIIDDYVATQLVPAVKQLGDVLKKEWEQAPQSTEAEVLASWSSVVDTVTEFSRRMLRELYDKLGESNYTLLLIEPKDERSLNLTETYIDIVFKRVIGEMAAGLKKESDRALARARGPRGDI